MRLPFSSSPGESLRETSQPQSHLPPLSPSPHSPHTRRPPKTAVSTATRRHSLGAPRCRLPEQHADGNPPKAPASQSASAQPEPARTPQAARGPVRQNMLLYMKLPTRGRGGGGRGVSTPARELLDISMIACYDHAMWSGGSALNPN